MLVVFSQNQDGKLTSQAQSVEQRETITHRLLKREQESAERIRNTSLSQEYAPRFDVLNRVIDDAVNTISQRKVDDSDETEIAIATLKAIESSLVNNHFLLHIPTKTLTDGLTAGPKKIQSILTQERLEFLAANPQLDDWYTFDCDTSAFIYMSVAEKMNLPLSFVEVPQHNFVRWHLKSGLHINWDTNSANVYTDDHYRKGQTPTASQGFGPEREERRKFLTDYREAEIIGYHTGILADVLRLQGSSREAIPLYEEAIAARPHAPDVKNNLSWILLTSSEFNESESAARALTLSLEVDAIDPWHKDYKGYKDTLACAYAAVGDFEKALEVERVAHIKTAKIEAFRDRKTCLDLGLK